MPLFTDGDINSLQDLQRYESSLLDVASTEQIDLNAKMSLAADEIGAELLIFLLKQTPQDLSNMVLTYQTVSIRRLLGVSDVVVTDPIKRWHALKSIELAYQDAYNNQLNDRYQGKFLQYQKRADIAADQANQIGVGLVWDPIPKATSPVLTSITGSHFASTVYVRVTWLNRAGQEGAASDVVALTTTDGTQLIVSPVSPPANAAGWNIYAGVAPDNATLQNSVPFTLQTDWLVPDTGLITGKEILAGQIPDWYVVGNRVRQRG